MVKLPSSGHEHSNAASISDCDFESLLGRKVNPLDISVSLFTDHGT